MKIVLNCAPFLLLLGLWFVMHRVIRAWGASLKKELVDALQENAQTGVLPEIRAPRESVNVLRAEIKTRDERHGQ